jgi:type IV secretion system protein VirD4
MSSDNFKTRDFFLGMLTPMNGVAQGKSQPLFAKPQGHFITFAGTRSGKTQCLAIPNLLMWDGPALVLDIKGELYEKTHRWREEHVGKTYRFAPMEGDKSDKFNPLWFVGGAKNDDLKIVDHARQLATMMLIPTSTKDQFWDANSLRVLEGLIIHECEENAPADRLISNLIDRCNAEDIPNIGEELSAINNPREFQNIGKAIKGIRGKTLDNVLATLDTSLAHWNGAPEKSSSGVPDWHPHDLLDPNKKITIYRGINGNQIKPRLSVVRTFIEAHLAFLMADHPHIHDPDRIIPFFLDEFAALRRMEQIQHTLFAGAGYGIRLWMFLQDASQLDVYDGGPQSFLSNCIIRTYMNPEFGTAKGISEQFGNMNNALGNEMPRVTPHDLIGKKYKESIVVLAQGQKPGIIDKYYAYKSDALKSKMENARRTEADKAKQRKSFRDVAKGRKKRGGGGNT